MLAHAYQRRDHVGLIAFRGAGADLVLPPTRSVEHAERRLRDLPIGGRTPLAHALHLAREVLARPAHAGRLPVIVLLSDGRANVPLAGGTPLEEAYAEAHALRDAGVRALVLDSETGPVRLGLAQRLAAALGADYRPLDDLDPAIAEQAVRAALPDLYSGTESVVPHAG
jgi:magnesium chelatase subunit D